MFTTKVIDHQIGQPFHYNESRLTCTISKGSDGGSGECINGGIGTDEDVTTYNFKNFELSPGAGSKPFEDGQWYRGGGGGGVLVNGEGPEMFNMGNKAGKGYGGGGTMHSFSLMVGRPGLILLEVVKAK